MKLTEFRVAFFARDFDASVHFYEDAFAMTLVEGWDRTDGKGALLSIAGTPVLEIYGAAEGSIYTGPSPVAINLAVQVETANEVDEVFDRLQTLGVLLQGSPEDRIWGHRSFVAIDPDGIPVHVYCVLD